MTTEERCAEIADKFFNDCKADGMDVCFDVKRLAELFRKVIAEERERCASGELAIE